jgi:signal transduction histidine kinase
MDYSGTRSSRTASRGLAHGAPRRSPHGRVDTRLAPGPVTRALLEAAAARSIQQPPVELVHVPAADLGRHFQWVIDAIDSGDTSHDVDEAGATLILRRRVVDVLRRELLRDWAAEPPEEGELMRALTRMEAVRDACLPAPDQAFAAELADRGGLELVVEVAHDMRSPLTSIVFLAEVLHRGHSGQLNDVQKRQVGIIYSAALGLVGMASDMIEVARGGSKLARPEPVPFSVNELLYSVRDLVRPTAEEKGLELRLRELPSENRSGHPAALSRVLLNLTSNALKYTHEGSVELAARQLPGHVVEFSVQDTGPGISDDAMTTMYQPFRRESKRSTGYYFSGTGLGLAICRRLVNALGSELCLETTEGAGTRFSFRVELPPASKL